MLYVYVCTCVCIQVCICVYIYVYISNKIKIPESIIKSRNINLKSSIQVKSSSRFKYYR